MRANPAPSTLLSVRLAVLRRLPWFELLLLVGATLFGHSFGSIAVQALEHVALHGPSEPDWPLVSIWLASGVALLCCMVLLYGRKHRLLRVRVFGEAKDVPARVLILSVSPPSSRGVETTLKFHPSKSGSPTRATLEYRVGNETRSLELGGRSTLSEDIKLQSGELRWNWQQVLRALEHQIVKKQERLPRLERVRLLGSSGTAGSAKHLPACRALLRMYRSGLEVPSDYLEGLDFTDFPRLLEAFTHMIEDERRRGTKPHEIIIDVTGGHKTVSMAAVCATLSSDIRIQYVESLEPGPSNPVRSAKVFVYNVVDQPAPSGGE